MGLWNICSTFVLFYKLIAVILTVVSFNGKADWLIKTEKMKFYNREEELEALNKVRELSFNEHSMFTVLTVDVG